MYQVPEEIQSRSGVDTDADRVRGIILASSFLEVANKPANLRKIGAVASIIGVGQLIFEGATIENADWENETNWKQYRGSTVTICDQADVEQAEPTENTKATSALRAWQGFMSWCTTSVFADLSTTTKTIIGALNELKTSITNILIDLGLTATQNPGVCARCRIYPADIVVDPIAMTVSVVTVRNGQNISASCPLRFFTDGDGVIHKWEFYAPITASFTKINGIWGFYINQTGQVLCDQTPWSDFATVAPIYRFYINDQLPNSEMIEPVCYEAHTTDTSASDHEWMHAQGTIHVSGFDHVSNQLTLDANGRPTTAPNADGRNTVIALTTGKSSNDGLAHTVTNSTDGVQFSQDLGNTTAASLNATNSALFRIRTNDAVGRLSFLPATRFPFPWNTVNNSPQFITTTGVRTDVTDNRWFVVFVYDFPDSVNGRAVKVVTAPQDFTTHALAVAYQWESIQGAYATMRDKEIRPLYKDIYYCDKSGGGAYPAGCKYAAKCSTTDIRTLKPVQTSASSGSVLASNVSVIPTTYFTATDQQTFDIDAGARIVKLETDETPAAINDADNVRFKSATGYYVRTLLAIKNYVKLGLKASEVVNDSNIVLSPTVKAAFDNADCVAVTSLQDTDMIPFGRANGAVSENKMIPALDAKDYFASAASGAVFVATEQELTEAFAAEKETMQICATAGITSGSISNIYAGNLWITGRKLIFDRGLIVPNSLSSRAVTRVFFDASVTMLGDVGEGAVVFAATAGIWHFTFRHLAQDMPIMFIAAGTSEIHVVCGNTITIDLASTGTYTVTQDSTLDLGQDGVRLDGSNVFNVGAAVDASTEVLIKANTGFVTLTTVQKLSEQALLYNRRALVVTIDRKVGDPVMYDLCDILIGWEIEYIDIVRKDNLGGQDYLIFACEDGGGNFIDISSAVGVQSTPNRTTRLHYLSSFPSTELYDFYKLDMIFINNYDVTKKLRVRVGGGYWDVSTLEFRVVIKRTL